MELNLSKINELLSDLTAIGRSKLLTKVETSVGHKGLRDGEDGYQGEYDETLNFYNANFLPENIFVKIVERTDSYGENNYVQSIQFVEGKAKTVTIYEPI